MLCKNKVDASARARRTQRRVCAQTATRVRANTKGRAVLVLAVCVAMAACCCSDVAERRSGLTRHPMCLPRDWPGGWVTLRRRSQSGGKSTLCELKACQRCAQRRRRGGGGREEEDGCSEGKAWWCLHFFCYLKSPIKKSWLSRKAIGNSNGPRFTFRGMFGRDLIKYTH